MFKSVFYGDTLLIDQCGEYFNMLPEVGVISLMIVYRRALPNPDPIHILNLFGSISDWVLRLENNGTIF